MEDSSLESKLPSKVSVLSVMRWIFMLPTTILVTVLASVIVNIILFAPSLLMNLYYQPGLELILNCISSSLSGFVFIVCAWVLAPSYKNIVPLASFFVLLAFAVLANIANILSSDYIGIISSVCLLISSGYTALTINKT